MTLRALLIALAIAAAGLPAAQAQAPDPARVEAARSMMEAAGASKQIDELMPLLAGQMSETFKRLVPDKGKEIDEVFQQLVPRFIEKKDALLDQIAALYAAELTLSEINGVAAFYKSPIGAKFARIRPGIMRQSAVLGQRWGQQIGMELDAEARQELKKRGIDL